MAGIRRTAHNLTGTGYLEALANGLTGLLHDGKGRNKGADTCLVKGKEAQLSKEAAAVTISQPNPRPALPLKNNLFPKKHAPPWQKTPT